MTHAQALESFILYISCYKINLPLAHKSKSFAKGRREDEKITNNHTYIAPQSDVLHISAVLSSSCHKANSYHKAWQFQN